MLAFYGAVLRAGSPGEEVLRLLNDSTTWKCEYAKVLAEIPATAGVKGSFPIGYVQIDCSSESRGIGPVSAYLTCRSSGTGYPDVRTCAQQAVDHERKTIDKQSYTVTTAPRTSEQKSETGEALSGVRCTANKTRTASNEQPTQQPKVLMRKTADGIEALCIITLESCTPPDKTPKFGMTVCEPLDQSGNPTRDASKSDSCRPWVDCENAHIELNRAYTEQPR